MSTLREDAQSVIQAALTATQPQQVVLRALTDLHLYGGRLRVLAIGKAAWGMAAAASAALGGRIDQGLIITKYGHAQGKLPRFTVMEAGHPILDENSVRAADAAIAMVQGLGVEDTVLMLISGGGSSLFEKTADSTIALCNHRQCASAQWGGYHGDEYYPQTVVRRKGWAVCQALRTGWGSGADPFGCSG